MQINESQIRRIIRKVINDPKKYSLRESVKSSRLEDKIDKVFSNPDAELGDLKLQKLYTAQDEAERLKSTYSGWVSNVDSLKGKSTEDKRDKKRITNKLQRIQYLIDLVLNPKKTKKAPEEPKKVAKKCPASPAKIKKHLNSPTQIKLCQQKPRIELVQFYSRAIKLKQFKILSAHLLRKQKKALMVSGGKIHQQPLQNG